MEKYYDSIEEMPEISAKEMTKNDPRNCVVKDINDEFAIAKIGELSVIMVKSNGYVNASKLCNDCERDFLEWVSEESTKELMSFLEKREKNSVIPLLTKRHEGVKNNLKGIYVHPDLVINLAMWCSPEYALKVSTIMESYHILSAKNKLLKDKDEKIDELKKIIKKEKKEAAMKRRKFEQATRLAK